MTALSLVVIPPEHIPTGMKAVHIGSPFLSTLLDELSTFGSKKVFVVANNSSRTFIEGDHEKLIDMLQSKGLLAAPLCTSIGMGGGEEGLLTACDAAYSADADVVVTVGGGAVQDAGKLIRLWLATKSDTATATAAARATVEGIQGVTKRDPMPSLPPQIALPNSFAMAEATHVAGLTTTAHTKSGAAHPSLMPTVIIYDPALSTGLPDWVRFGTGLRGVEHAVGAITHPHSTDDIRSRALEGLTMIQTNLRKLVSNPECPTAQNNLYRGGFLAVRALNTGGCYPSLGHLIQNHYSARYNVHQGSCSGILCARILDYHSEVSKEYQQRIVEALGGDNTETTTAAQLVRELVATLPAVKNEHAQVGVTEEMLKEFTEWMWENAWSRYNALSPKDFESVEDMYGMLTKPLVDL